jgi:hypothetical protein
VQYELVFYIPEDAILHIQRPKNLKSYSMSTEPMTGNGCFTIAGFDSDYLAVGLRAKESLPFFKMED